VSSEKKREEEKREEEKGGREGNDPFIYFFLSAPKMQG